MADRTQFNRSYTAYDQFGTTVYLVNGGLKASASGFNPVIDLPAGEDLLAGDAVYVDSTATIYKATAASGQAPQYANVIGFVEADTASGDRANVDIDGIATINSNNVAGEAAMTPGKYYFLSKYSGQITRNNTPSGTIDAAGYMASAPLGVAVTSTALTIEISIPTFLV